MNPDRPGFERLHGIYLGRVVEHLDGGRYKVFVPGVYSDSYKVSSSFLPPAVLAGSAETGGVNGDGDVSYVNIGAVVYCFFANGDQNLPVIFAVSTGGNDFDGTMSLVNLSEFLEDEASELEYKTSNSVRIVKQGKVTTTVDQSGRYQVAAKRNSSILVDRPNRTYSHSMHMLNLMRAQQRVQDSNYFVFSNDPDGVMSSEIRFKPVAAYSSDADSGWFSDHLNDVDDKDFVCIGISCVISEESDEDYLVGAKIDCPIAGIQNEESWNRGVFTSWGGQTHEKPCYVRENGRVKNVYINCDGLDNFVEFAASEGADLYVCNGEQYGFETEYWDKCFQGSYSSHASDSGDAGSALADAKKHDINVYILNPYKVTACFELSETGGSLLSVLNQKIEYEQAVRNDGEGQTSSYQFIQDGEYGSVGRAISGYYLKSKSENLRDLSVFETDRHYGYSGEDGRMRLTDISSSRSLSGEFYKHENLTAEIGPLFGTMTREQYEQGGRNDVGVSVYSNAYGLERWLSRRPVSGDVSSGISCMEYFVRNEHCSADGLVSTSVSSVVSSDLDGSSWEDFQLCSWNVQSADVRHLNSDGGTVSTDFELLSSRHAYDGASTDDFVEISKRARPNLAAMNQYLSSVDAVSGTSDTVAVTYATGGAKAEYSRWLASASGGTTKSEITTEELTEDSVSRKTVVDSEESTETFHEMDSANGKITVSVKGPSGSVSVVIDRDGNVNVTGTNSLTVSIGGSKLVMSEAGTVAITGDTTIEGTLTVTGAIASTGGDVSSNKVTLNTHTHICGTGSTDIAQ